MENVRIALITPTRGDRPRLLERCKYYMKQQKVNFKHVIVDFTPTSREADLRERINEGVFRACALDDVDLIFIIEDDDFYSPIYLRAMIERWKILGKPDLMGIDNTTYYHVGTNKYWTKQHANHSSLFCTCFTPALAEKIEYAKIQKVWVDIYLWDNFKGVTTSFKKPICMGIKHGIGKSAGIGHNPNAAIYRNEDPNGEFLKEVVGEYNFNFYNSLL